MDRISRCSTAVPLTDVFPCGSLDKNDHLQGEFEQQQKGLDALGRVQINRLDAQWPLGTAIDMRAFVLFLWARMASLMLKRCGSLLVSIGGLPMGEDFSSRVQGNSLIDDALDAAFFEIVSQDGSKAHGLSLVIFYYGSSHLWRAS